MRFEIEKEKTVTEIVKKTLELSLCNVSCYGGLTLIVNGYHVLKISKQGKCSLISGCYNCGLETDNEGKILLER